MNIAIFEDDGHGDFYPLSLTRPVWELKCGCFSLRERWERFFRASLPGENHQFHYLTREKLAPHFREKHPDIAINEPDFCADDILLVNAALLPDERILGLGAGDIIMRDSRPLAARRALDLRACPADGIADMLRKDPSLKRVDGAGLRAFEYLWDLVDMNGELMRGDYPMLSNSGAQGSDVTIVGDRTHVYIDREARLDPFVFIDATKGPVVVRGGSRIHSFTRIEGPCYIGHDCVVLGAKLRAGCHIGDSCRIGGEVEASIFQGYSNKYHDGFIGHSYIGEWVNLGALTTNSDLKNNYSRVKVTFPWRRVATGSVKVGCFIGDFTRTSIGTLISTGCTVGACCMIVHAGEMTPHYVPSFAWFTDNRILEGEHVGAMLPSFERAMERRGRRLSALHREMLEGLYDTCAENRRAETERWKERWK